MNNPILFIHGAGDSAQIWREQTVFFRERAHALDLPGHGQRPNSLPEQANVVDYARAVETILREELRLEKPIIVGHSLGGLIALQMGLTYGSQLGGMILIGTGARLRVHPSLLEAARTEPDRAISMLKQLATTQPEEQVSTPNKDGKQLSSILYRDLQACNSFDVMNRLQELHSLPTLIVCGTEDRNAPVKFSTYLHEHISGSDLKIIPEAGHYVYREKPLEVNQAIEAWLDAN